MKTLVNINNGSKITVPNVVIGERNYIIENEYLNIKYLIGDVYLDKTEWTLNE